MDRNRLMGAQVRRPSGPLGWLLGHMMARGHRQLTEWAIGLLDVQRSDRVLDLGCGSGMAIQLLCGIATSGSVAGLDYSTVMVRQARRRNAAAVTAGMAGVLLGDVAALPYSDGSFDRLIAVETFYFWPHPLACLREAHRVVRPGGRAAIAMEMSKEENPARHKSTDAAAAYGFTIYAADEMTNLLQQAGFGHVRIVSEQDQGEGWLCATGVA